MAVTADLVAVAFARFASPNPDGLAFVSQNLGLAAAAGEAPVGRSWSDNGIEITWKPGGGWQFTDRHGAVLHRFTERAIGDLGPSGPSGLNQSSGVST